MTMALIGYTGFVGGALNRQYQFDDLYRSTNINKIKNKHYELIVCAGTPGQKWKANQQPSEDYQSITILINALQTVTCDQFVLISTIDVYKSPVNVSETSKIDINDLQPYGLHRFYMEKFVCENFRKHLIIRLPGLFGFGLKKNFIFDMLTTKSSIWTDYRSFFQFYNLDMLWFDIQKVLPYHINLINFATQPISAHEIAKICFEHEFYNKTKDGPVFYDMHTEYAPILGGQGPYFIKKDDEIRQILTFVKNQKAQ